VQNATRKSREMKSKVAQTDSKRHGITFGPFHRWLRLGWLVSNGLMIFERTRHNLRFNLRRHCRPWTRHLSGALDSPSKGTSVHCEVKKYILAPSVHSNTVFLQMQCCLGCSLICSDRIRQQNQPSDQFASNDFEAFFC
jgi:hypothetical protein